MIRHLPPGSFAHGRVGSGQIDWRTGDSVPSVNLPAGSIVQYVASTPFTSYATLGTNVPLDDTIPTSTEGTQIHTLTITPKVSTNKILLRFQAIGSLDGAAALIGFIQKDGTTVSTTSVSIGTAGSLQNIILQHEDSPGDTAAHTYTARMGPSAGNAYINGNTTNRRFGGTCESTLTAEEIQV